ncbi:aminotransferase class I/II-fold pyridoxal phosphate-dependent enzyme [Inediibacterium massiliense]|uniref:aminotransferase class I/II-fold pyridoxal phosphate-dependent enzyme n=1 Tax=Inediibacterium massiliense TaxID=1658111 RepID=UPI0006B4C5C5|nr:aminotransferase class I/II-fold pyridoxal phosphate-dependent enzyme [Inediibacterium massiliense]
MDTCIINKLKSMRDENIISFHVPGHKNGKAYEKYNIGNLLSIDVTEIEGTDNLHEPAGIIKDAQDHAAQFFGADHTFFLVNGTSCGNISALMAVANPKDQVIVPRDCHKSVMNGLILGGIDPIYIEPKVDEKNRLPMGVTHEEVRKAIINHPDIKAVVLTYPNYYGICPDINKIVQVVHEYNKILIVDEAHGSHFILNEDLPCSALQAGADIVIQSTHKTLFGFTQASMLHVKSKRVDIERLRFMLTIHQSSSPSYLLMSSLDMARAIAQRKGTILMGELLKNIDWFSDELQKIDGVKIIDTVSPWNKDQTRLVISMKKLGISGVELENILRKEYKIQMEMSDSHYIVGVCTIGNTKEDFKKLLYAIKEIKGQSKEIHEEEKISCSYVSPIVRISPREAVFLPKKIIPMEESIGKVSGEYIIPYPPGVPMVCPGEEITEEIINQIMYMKKNKINMIGMEDSSLQSLKIIIEK